MLSRRLALEASVVGYINRRNLLTGAAGAGAALALARPSFAQAPAVSAGDPLADVDALAAAFMAEFGTPGVALAVIRPGQPDWLRGYGVRELGKPGAVDPDTRFAVASNTKSMTAALLATLVDEGKLGWEDPVTKHLPDFAMYDPATTQAMTIRDLLVHRSGLPLGAGDLMIWPTTTHTRAEVVHGLRYLKPVRGFRTGYDYDNVLYIVAGAVVEKVTGQTWEQAVGTRILTPAGMTTAVPAPSLAPAANLAGRHVKLGGPVYGMGTMQRVERQETDSFAPAGGVQASVRDMAAWLRLQLAHGKAADGRQVWSEAQATELWKPQTLISNTAGPTAEEPGRSIFNTYALGWNVFDYRGERVVGHSGAMNGQLTITAMIPARNVGVVVLTNAEERGVMSGLRNALLDRMMGAPAFDWLAYYRKSVADQKAKALAELAAADTARPAGGPTRPLDAYVGLYRDPWYGDMSVSRKGKTLSIAMLKSPMMKGPLESWGPDVFRTRFPDRTLEDAIVTFAFGPDGKVSGVTMKAASPLADFSYDFHHLAFTPVVG